MGEIGLERACPIPVERSAVCGETASREGLWRDNLDGKKNRIGTEPKAGSGGDLSHEARMGSRKRDIVGWLSVWRTVARWIARVPSTPRRTLLGHRMTDNATAAWARTTGHRSWKDR